MSCPSFIDTAYFLSIQEVPGGTNRWSKRVQLDEYWCFSGRDSGHFTSGNDVGLATHVYNVELS